MFLVFRPVFAVQISGVHPEQGSEIEAIIWWICRHTINLKWCRCKLVLFTNRKLHLGLSIGTKIGDLEPPSGHLYALFHTVRQLLEPTAWNSLKPDPYCQRQIYSPGSLVFGSVRFVGDGVCYLCGGWTFCFIQFTLNFWWAV